MSSRRTERTFIAIKPDAVQRGLVNEVIRRYEQKGYTLLGMKMVKASRELLAEHYAEHKGKPFLEPLISFMMSGPIVAMVWQGTNVISEGRRILGKTNPMQADLGTIRGDFGIDVGRNLVHGSDGPESAEREIKLWFKNDELISWDRSVNNWVYEN